MGQDLKKRTKSSGEGTEAVIGDTIYWLASTFHWTLPMIYEVSLLELQCLMEASNKSIEKQNKAMKTQGGKSGKFNVESMSQLKNLPGTKVIKGPKKR